MEPREKEKKGWERRECVFGSSRDGALRYVADLRTILCCAACLGLPVSIPPTHSRILDSERWTASTVARQSPRFAVGP